MYSQYEKLLEKTGKTTADVVRDTGIAHSTISEWKSGRSTPKADKFFILARYFGVPMEYFFEEASYGRS